MTETEIETATATATATDIPITDQESVEGKMIVTTTTETPEDQEITRGDQRAAGQTAGVREILP